MGLPISRPLDFSEIPVIDISPLPESNGKHDQTVNGIRQACPNVGFFYIRNPGIKSDLIDSLIESGRGFS